MEIAQKGNHQDYYSFQSRPRSPEGVTDRRFSVRVRDGNEQDPPCTQFPSTGSETPLSPDVFRKSCFLIHRNINIGPDINPVPSIPENLKFIYG